MLESYTADIPLTNESFQYSEVKSKNNKLESNNDLPLKVENFANTTDRLEYIT